MSYIATATATSPSIIFSILSKGSKLVHKLDGKNWEVNYTSPNEALWSLIEYGLTQVQDDEHLVISHMGDCLCLEYRDSYEEYTSPETGKVYSHTNFAQLIYVE